MTVNVMDRTMSTSITLFYQNFNANDVDIMVFEPCVIIPPATAWGGIEHMVLFFDSIYQLSKRSNKVKEDPKRHVQCQ